MNTIKINLNDFEKIKRFATVVSNFKSDINIYKDNPNDCFDAKSLLELYAIVDLSKSAYVKINTWNEDELVNFIKAMKEFE